AHERAAGQRVKRGTLRFGVKAPANGANVKCATPDALRMNVLRFADIVAAGQAAHRRVFIRADLNVPQDHSPAGGGRITEDTRTRASLPCVKMALPAGTEVMVTSHLGRPTEGQPKAEDSLAPIAARLAELLG